MICWNYKKTCRQEPYYIHRSLDKKSPKLWPLLHSLANIFPKQKHSTFTSSRVWMLSPSSIKHRAIFLLPRLLRLLRNCLDSLCVCVCVCLFLFVCMSYLCLYKYMPVDTDVGMYLHYKVQTLVSLLMFLMPREYQMEIWGEGWRGHGLAYNLEVKQSLSLLTVTFSPIFCYF